MGLILILIITLSTAAVYGLLGYLLQKFQADHTIMCRFYYSLGFLTFSSLAILICSWQGQPPPFAVGQNGDGGKGPDGMSEIAVPQPSADTCHRKRIPWVLRRFRKQKLSRRNAR
jgi:hypothetical protein